MSDWGRWALLFGAFCSLAVSAFSQDSDVSGTVRDGAGIPLAGVRVYGDTHHPIDDRVTAETDAQGHFQLKNVSRAIFFVASKYEPATYLRQPGESGIEISLKADSANHWPRTCPAGNEPGRRIGSRYLRLVPKGVKVKRIPDVDTTTFLIRFPGKTHEELNLWSGARLGTSFAPEAWLEASEFRERNNGGFDWKGKSRDGKNWRWVSGSQDLIRYDRASDEAAAFFDGIIDSVCVEDLDRERK